MQNWRVKSGPGRNSRLPPFHLGASHLTRCPATCRHSPAAFVRLAKGCGNNWKIALIWLARARLLPCASCCCGMRRTLVIDGAAMLRNHTTLHHAGTRKPQRTEGSLHPRAFLLCLSISLSSRERLESRSETTSKAHTYLLCSVAQRTMRLAFFITRQELLLRQRYQNWNTTTDKVVNQIVNCSTAG